jgi:competence protein ComEA
MHKKSGLLISMILIHANAACVDLNLVRANQLMHLLPRIGYKKARAIIHYRHRYHGFSSLYELEAVKGLGVRYLEQNRQRIERIFCKIES